ncbi:MAG TPA: 7-cyano-7-deazaguanine synthase QueC [Hyphomicrobiaceae bacterium]|jgi:7-cyano-7-deazaguanine synthase|nr:7-cyano-7-deazaguanine synthase QueC [Hyphomicrobiaceae bacterium]
MAQAAALVLFSGGQDSTVCLAWALERYARVETVGFAYGQRHAIELQQRPIIRAELAARFESWRARLGEDHVLELMTLGEISDTALTRDAAFAMTAAGLPNTFVPGRNLLFCTLAAALGFRRDITVLIGGMCETDYSGYPDCRNDTLQALAKAISLGLDRPVRIETPLMWIDKAATWSLAARLGGSALVELIIEHTHTCYRVERGRRHPWGYGCGDCPACSLRAKGWEKWQLTARS